MKSKDAKNNTHPLKTWWLDWARFDLTILPVGFILAYYLKDLANGFWLNLSTELIGAYISVRIIDQFLKRKEKRHFDRREIVDNVFWFYEVASKLLPYVDEWRIKDLQQEIKYFGLRWDDRKNLFEMDEIKIIDEIVASRDKIVALSLDYVRHISTSNRLENEFIENYPDRPKWWIRLENRFHDYQKTMLDSDSIQEALDEAGKIIDQKIVPAERLKALTAYFHEIAAIGRVRGEIALEVRNHERLSYLLKNNIYQESG